MTNKKSKKTSQDDNVLKYKKDSHSNNISDVIYKIKDFHQDLLVKDKLNSSALSSIQRNLDKLHGLEKEILYMKRQVDAIQENKTEIYNLKESLKVSSCFSTFINIIFVIIILALVLICFYKVIT